LAFTTACVQAKYILRIDDQARLTPRPPMVSSKPPRPEPSLGAANR
jgi:hypothetical protein